MNAFMKIWLAAAFLVLLLSGFFPMAAIAAVGTPLSEPLSAGMSTSPASPIKDSGGSFPAGNQAGELSAPAGPGELTEQVPIPEGSRACGTMDDLLWLVNRDGARLISLTSDIEWDAPVGNYEFLLLPKQQDTTILMGGYGIRIPPGCGFLAESMRFEGSGVTKPLFTVEGSFDCHAVDIEAAGDGAIAMSVTGGGYIESDMVSISAAGKDSVALQLLDDQDYAFSYAHFMARGENSAAIIAQGDVSLLLCAASADGEAVRTPGAVLLDGSTAVPQPAGAKVVRRRIAPSQNMDRVGVILELGGRREDAAPPKLTYPFAAIGEDGTVQGVTVSALNTSYEGIPKDLSRPMTGICAYSPELPDWFPVKAPVFHANTCVFDPNRQAVLSFVSLESDLDDRYKAVIELHQPLEDTSGVSVQYSLDGGKSWTETESAMSLWNDTQIQIPDLLPDRTYLVRLVVEGGPMAGISNTARLSTFASGIDEEDWGDRDDGDRGEQGELPSGPVIPPPSGGSGHTDNRDDAHSSSSVAVPADNKDGTRPDAPEPSVPTESSMVSQAAMELKAPEEANLYLTASELAAQRKANPGGITLIGEKLRVMLPDALLETFPAGVTLYAQLEIVAPDQFIVRFWAGAQPVERVDIPFWVGIDELPLCITERAVCVRMDSESDPCPTVKGSDGRWRFKLNAAGAYRIIENPQPAFSSAASPPIVSESTVGAAAVTSADSDLLKSDVHLWPMILLVAGLAGGVAYLLARRKGGQQ